MMNPASRLKRSLIVTLVLAAGFLAAWVISTSAPKPQRVKPQPVPRLVETVAVERQTSRPFWPSGGEVRAAEQVALSAQVAARVVRVHEQAIPGAVVRKGTPLVTLESADYELQVRQMQAALAQAKAQQQIEEGQAALAREEYRIAAQELSPAEQALVLREPQQAAAAAAVQTAQANLQQARLNLARTTLVMPFDGQILARQISTGSQVNTSTPLFELVRTDRFWIEVKVPRAFLPLLDRSAPAQVTPPGHSQTKREAQVLGVLPGVSSTDRQAVVLLELREPLQGDTPVLAGDYVEVMLPGRELTDSVVMPSRYLQDDGSVWVVNNDQLHKRTPQILFRGREQVWLGDGFAAGDRILRSRVDSAVTGMAVRVQEERP